MITNKATSLFLMLVTLGGSIVILHYIYKDAFVYLALLWLAACVGVMCVAKSEWLRLGALYTGTVILTVGGYEAYLGGWFSKPLPQLVTPFYSHSGYFQTHPLLGYAPQRACQTRATKYYDNKTVYDVTYTIDAHGWRMTPRTSHEAATSVAFFGCSYTFGEGVNDNETLPSRFEEKSAGRFTAFNFAFQGYGPHQMLTILENELEKPALSAQRPRYAIYQALTTHVTRCTGRALWDKSGPRYVLNEQGEAVYTGPFENLYVSNFMKIMTRSSVWRRWSASTSPSTAADVDLYVGIVTKAAEIFHKRYGGEFYVLLWPAWPGDEGRYAQVFTKLSANKIRVIKVENLLPDHNPDEGKYRIPIDTHPSPLAYEKIAEGLAKLF